ncbi:glycosyl transferase [Polaromonas glacialis]|uniref:glycosyl transferase n=1 Tax=Polaromonas glacialis TaxID=866564 RepID=UPI000A0679FC|nr:glycosyl transferase [Polaromonas glacialis]
MENFAAVTICSINYIGKALVLIDSYVKYHPEHGIYLILVDRKSEDVIIDRPGLNVIWAEDLGIQDFLKYAFTYDVIEFNTNVKPTALKFLLKKHEIAVYLDPDIKIYAPLDPVFDALKNGASLVVTPHCNTPILDGCKPDDLDLLKFGAFNLGFVGVSRCQEGLAFLDWWSDRCLGHGFYEPQLGLGVDQKWVGLAPCYFPSMQVLHDSGLNVAFWNLHERQLTSHDGIWFVNETTLLRFVHFSSFNENKPEVVAKKQTRFESGSRPDFSSIAEVYASELLRNASEAFSRHRYTFDYFEDGSYVTPALRRFYAVMKNTVFHKDENPFRLDGPVMRFGKSHGLVGAPSQAARRQIFKDMNAYGPQIKVINMMLRLSLFILGADRYFNLMRYMAHISSLRNQVDMFGRIDSK